jgi:hypothetical protein
MAGMAAAPLSDGRLQVWVVDQEGNLRSRWKLTIDPNANWAGWSGFPQPAPLVSVAAAQLTDGRLQLFALDENGGTWSAWKTTTDPDAVWTSWSGF